jgi:hypothetical protein
MENDKLEEIREIKPCFGKFDELFCVFCQLKIPCLNWKYCIFNYRRNWLILSLVFITFVFGVVDIAVGTLQTDIFFKVYICTFGLATLIFIGSILYYEWEEWKTIRKILSKRGE